MFLQETYELEDCMYFNDMTSADTTHWTIPASANASYTSNGMKLQASAWSECYLEMPITKPASIEFDLMDYTGTNAYTLYLWDSTKTNRRISMYITEGGWTTLDVYGSSSNAIPEAIPKGSHVKIDVNNSELRLYVGGTLKLSKSYTMDNPFIFDIASGTNRIVTYKNIKVKPL